MPAARRNALTFLKYALVQVPAAALVLVGLLLLRHWLDLPRWVVWAAFGGWLIKDILLFPLLRNAYETGAPAPGGSLIGARGIARERLEPTGYVLVGGELWQAELSPGAQSVEAGAEVRVLGLRGLTLLVEAAEPLTTGEEVPRQ